MVTAVALLLFLMSSCRQSDRTALNETYNSEFMVSRAQMCG